MIKKKIKTQKNGESRFLSIKKPAAKKGFSAPHPADDQAEGEREIRIKGGFSRLRGMRDVLPDEYKYWDLAIKKAVELAKFYGFKKMETPVLERLELYERSTGKETDIVSKEMYSFVDKSGDKVALRPEATPGIVRAYVEHGMFNLPQPVKIFWLGSFFRHEKPQSGRYREARQFDLEIFGEEKPAAEAELIQVVYNFFKELQVEANIQINSIGCKDCRAEYLKKLTAYFSEKQNRAKLCPDCRIRLKKNPMRILDCKEAGCSEAKSRAPQMVDSLCEPCRAHFVQVLEYLDELEIPYNLNPYLVRGLDYYNRTVFEIWSGDEEEGRQSALGGGGRYDGLIEYMGGRPTPACGFAIGLERAISKAKEKNISVKEGDEGCVFIAQLGKAAKIKAMKLFEEMRRAGFPVRLSFTKDSLKSQLEEADRMKARFSLILGQKEVMDGTILLRDMDSGIQEVIDFKKIKEEIDRRLKE